MVNETKIKESKKMKIVFIVTGSEDGVLGVYGNKKSAYNRAVKYVTQGSIRDYDNNEIPISKMGIMSYSKVCKELKDVYSYSIDICENETWGMGNAEILAMPFNLDKFGEK
mgnify:FL=1|tara:strand:- start:191 stop:523 length:333 start_codon:yes stop_codon:yes gene_type:complete